MLGMSSALSEENNPQESDLTAEVRAVCFPDYVGALPVSNHTDLLLLLLLQFALLAHLPVQLAAVSEHEVLKIAAEVLISVFPAVQYVRCAFKARDHPAACRAGQQCCSCTPAKRVTAHAGGYIVTLLYSNLQTYVRSLLIAQGEVLRCTVEGPCNCLSAAPSHCESSFLIIYSQTASPAVISAVKCSPAGYCWCLRTTSPASCWSGAATRS